MKFEIKIKQKTKNKKHLQKANVVSKLKAKNKN